MLLSGVRLRVRRKRARSGDAAPLKDLIGICLSVESCNSIEEALLTDEVYKVQTTVPCEPRFTSHRDLTGHLWSKRQTRIVMIARIAGFFGYKINTV
jgi:hypothetical protein